MTDPAEDAVLKHLLPPAWYAVDPAEWRAVVADYRQAAGCDWLACLVDSSLGGNTVGDAVADMAARLDAVTAERDALRAALLLACARVADGPQRYHEANTPEGWADVYLEAARAGRGQT